MLISTPIILAASFAAAFFLFPEIDPVLTLSISDIPVRHNWPMHYDRNMEPIPMGGLRYLQHLQKTATEGHFACNIKYFVGYTIIK
ncbi:hypothetical protein CV014_28170 [Nostoc sp. CMAA1605]|nr:hypothetical protein [Nostoc sp. CMAA1605]